VSAKQFDRLRDALARLQETPEPQPSAGESDLRREARGPFEVLGELGRGRMGVVLCARDTRLGRDVALKILPAELVRRPEVLARIGRETRLLAALNHPNVAQVHGVERHDGTSALVMELVEGKSLAERVAGRPLALPEALEILRQAAAAVEAAHDRGILHGDLRPSNIMLGPRGEVKVLDFGIARALDPRGAHASDEAPPGMLESGAPTCGRSAASASSS
jgi:serine/threonine-protein kinase